MISLLDKTGATLKEAMQLARHGDPRLTAAVYGRARLHDLGEASDRLPSLSVGPTTEAPAMLATGTHDAVPFCTDFVQKVDSGRERLGVIGSIDASTMENETGPNPLNHQEIGASRERLGVIEKAPRVGLEPTTNRLTAGCSTIELSGNGSGGRRFFFRRYVL